MPNGLFDIKTLNAIARSATFSVHVKDVFSNNPETAENFMNKRQKELGGQTPREAVMSCRQDADKAIGLLNKLKL